MIRPMVFTAAVLAVTLFAMTAFTSTVSAQTPTATATATAAAPKATATATTAAPAKTGNAGLSSATSTSTVLVLSFVAIAGVATLAARRATRSN